jgi:hypothetical protein
MYYSSCSYDTKVGAESKGVKNGKFQIFGEKNNCRQHKFYRLFFLVKINYKPLMIEHGFVTLE